MMKSFDYQKRADECALHAATAANDRAREVWHRLEAFWRKRASDTAVAKMGVTSSTVPGRASP